MKKQQLSEHQTRHENLYKKNYIQQYAKNAF